MKNIRVFIFDEIFESMVDDDQIAKLRALDARLHIVSKKCQIASYEPLHEPSGNKILCINPDFVDWSFPADAYRHIPGLRMIISSSDNISWFETDYADANNIRYAALENLTTEYSAVAQYAITIMLDLARNIPLLVRNRFPLDYAQDFITYQGVDIAGKTAGIIGLGNIGSAVARLCEGLGLRVIYWSRTEKPGNSYIYRGIDDLLREADIIFPTLKPNGETKLLLLTKKLETIKRDAIVVSVVDGLVDNAYLARRVAENALFGYGFGAEPGTFADYNGNVWAVPDYAWATKENMRASYSQLVEKIIDSVERLS